MSSRQSPGQDDRESASAGQLEALPDFPQATTSFGAALADDAVYLYGGHIGEAHSYSRTEQGSTLWRLDLENPKQWTPLPVEGPGLQGLALVAVEGRLYRLGGFMARNEKGEEHNLWSVADVATCETANGLVWHESLSLPEPRSSFDAAVVNGRIYVVGGWQLRGDEEAEWHDTAWVWEPGGDREWKAIATPPFQRRALATAGFGGKLYVIGGMENEGGPSTRVDVYDPANDSWTRGPNLVGEPMSGFGCMACATGGRLYVSTVIGELQRLSEDGTSWEVVQGLERGRFFHRMLPLDDHRLMIVGGAHMETGKYTEVDVVNVE